MATREAEADEDDGNTPASTTDGTQEMRTTAVATKNFEPTKNCFIERERL